MKRRDLVWIVPLALAACTRPLAPVPPPPALHTVAVFPATNRTGNELLVEGGSPLEQYVFHTDRVTVADVLAAEARRQLERRGVRVVAPEIVDAAVADYQPRTVETAARQAARNHIDAAVLYIEIRRWEPDAPFEPHSIIVSLTATLIDPSDGRILWSAERPSRPVATPGSVNPGAADVLAAVASLEDLLAPLAALPPATITPAGSR